MLAIKFKRIGKKHQPSYRIIVAEKRSKMSRDCVEDLGWYNPVSKEFKVNKERAEYRLKTGAQPTATAHNLLVRAGVIAGKKKSVHKKKKKVEDK
jgi:small subunit ribosomal protein S16